MEENKNTEEKKNVEMSAVDYGPVQMLHAERDGKHFFLYFPADTTYKEAYDGTLNILQGIVELSKKSQAALDKKADSEGGEKEDTGNQDEKGDADKG